MSDSLNKVMGEVGKAIKERAFSVKEELRTHRGSSEEPFLEGMLVAYRRTIALMQEKAGECGIELGSISIDDIDPRRDLRSMKEV